MIQDKIDSSNIPLLGVEAATAIAELERYSETLATLWGESESTVRPILTVRCRAWAHDGMFDSLSGDYGMDIEDDVILHSARPSQSGALGDSIITLMNAGGLLFSTYLKYIEIVGKIEHGTDS